MKKITLDCFQSELACQISSEAQSLQIKDFLDQNLAVEIFNHSDQICQLSFRLETQDENFDVKEIQATVSDQKQLFFNDNLSLLAAQSQALGTIEAQAATTYFLSIDLLKMFLLIEDHAWSFNLLFDFNCQETVDPSSTLKASSASNVTVTTSPIIEPNGAVLAAVDQSQEENNISKFWQLDIIQGLIVFGLFVIIFFVIMKLVHGKKKKQASSKTF